ncbi:valine--tRNA ligase [Candidatus Saccharibacteria bacterium]|nr:valine--tRNA ligase [Candidatus Saccharibacteria bacterium]
MKLSKAYEPNTYEPEVYALWETSGAFAPTGQGEPYSIVMPPPNANADLHVGHSLETIKDIVIRYQRMNGRDTIYIPGADHAGFETWVVFEKALEKEGKSRFDFSREILYKMTWDFVEQNRGNMELQVRALGVSCDWAANTFTLDKKVVETVYETFKKMWDEGLIYRGERIVNYCTQHQTSFADIEVVFREEKSHLWHIAYPVVENETAAEIIVATTRPETMLGDMAVAVHPDDKKYKDLVGKMVRLPLTDREIPIVADEAVELGFGTGAVKVTPAHDPLDFDIGQRHDLEPLQIIGLDGKITDNAPRKYRGMDVDTARETVVKDLEELGLIRKIEKFEHQVPHCYKCGSVIQPLIMKQWFMDVQPLAQRAKKVVEAGEIKFTPAQKADELVRYYDEMRDWNISRQIPWGIPIPAFQNVADEDDWIFDARVDQAEITVAGKTYQRDNDTFDTWFSSGQWPFITTDFLSGGELARFYPTTLMEHGVDIMRPWCSRMIMFGLYRTGQVPFRNVYLHGMVTDEKGQKMSKSKNNVVNPMDIIDEYGSDALRIGIVMNRSAGQAQAFSVASVVAGRNFCNKLWNIARFIEGQDKNRDIDEPKSLPEAVRSYDEAKVISPVTTGGNHVPKEDGLASPINSASAPTLLPRRSSCLSSQDSSLTLSPSFDSRVAVSCGSALDAPISLADHWVLRQLDTARKTIDGHIKNYRFAEAVDIVYHVVWDDVADWFIEASKINPRPAFLRHVLDIILRLVHPFAPFVSETIWMTLHDDETLLISQKWPEKLIFDKAKAAEFDQIKELVSSVRFITTELPAGKYDLIYEHEPLINENSDLIEALAGLKSVRPTKKGRGMRLAVTDHAAWLDIDEDLLYEHQTRLEMRLVAVREEITNLEKRLSSSGYVDRAPKHLVEETKRQLDDKRTLETRLIAELDVMKE